MLDAKTIESYLPVKVWLLKSKPDFKYGIAVAVKFALEILDWGELGRINKEFFDEFGFIPDRQVDLNKADPNVYIEFSSHGPNAPPELVEIAHA